MSVSEFNHPDNPLLGPLLESEPEAPLTDLPGLDPQYTQDPVPEAERNSPQPPNDGEPRTGRNPADNGGVGGGGLAGASSPAAAPPPFNPDRTIRALQEDQIEMSHHLVNVEADLHRTQRALQILALSIALAAALVALTVLKHERANSGTLS